MNKLIAATAGAAAIGVGALTVGSLLPVGALQTQEEESPAPPDDTGGERVGPRRILDAALTELVENGTLTQEQADAVLAEVQERVDALPDRPGDGHPWLRLLYNGVEIAAETIGIEPAELREALRNGQSIAEVAEANGVAPDAVVVALVEAGNAAIDEAVANGRIDEERAAELRENLPEHAQIFVDRNRPDRGDRPRGVGD
jgi:polyhydroxyalkanoate synthesis regulator phasin